MIFLLKEAKKSDIEVFVLGRGSNTLVSDNGFNGLVIRLNHPTWTEIEWLDKYTFKVGGGVRLQALCKQTIKKGLDGFCFLGGIPGSLGGGLSMNAGAYGEEIFNFVQSVEYLMLEGKLEQKSHKELKAEYRNCPTLKNTIILSAIFKKHPDIQPTHFTTKK